MGKAPERKDDIMDSLVVPWKNGTGVAPVSI